VREKKELVFCKLIRTQLFRYWTEKGICWARNSEVQDIDDTAMGFRLLRLHGHQVSASELFVYTKPNISLSSFMLSTYLSYCLERYYFPN